MSTAADDNSKGRAVVFWLVVGHFVAGLVSCAVRRANASHEWVEAVFVGLVFSQTSLLGVWGGLSVNTLLARSAGVLCGLIYLGGLFCAAVNDFEIELVLMIFFAGLSVAGTLAVSRFFGTRIVVVDFIRPATTAALGSTVRLSSETLGGGENRY